MSFRTLVIVNPHSADGATGRRWPELKAALDRVLGRWEDAFTAGPRDATRVAREAAEAGYEMLVSVGGDGTMSEIVSGLFAPDPELGISDRLVRDDLVLGCVRAGTGGDFARMLGLTHKLPGAVGHLEGDATRPCDLGLVEYATRDGGRSRTAFMNIASFGLSGMVDEKVNGSSKALGGTASFMVGLGKALWAYRPAPVRVAVDGEPFYEGEITTCAVANGQYFGGGMCFARDAQIDDGRFDVVAQLRAGVREVLSVRDLYTGRMADWASVRCTRGQVVRAEPLGDDPVLLDIDGEPLGILPATFRLLPGAVRLKSH